MMMMMISRLWIVLIDSSLLYSSFWLSGQVRRDSCYLLAMRLAIGVLSIESVEHVFSPSLLVLLSFQVRC